MKNLAFFLLAIAPSCSAFSPCAPSSFISRNPTVFAGPSYWPPSSGAHSTAAHKKESIYSTALAALDSDKASKDKVTAQREVVATIIEQRSKKFEALKKEGESIVEQRERMRKSYEAAAKFNAQMSEGVETVKRRSELQAEYAAMTKFNAMKLAGEAVVRQRKKMEASYRKLAKFNAQKEDGQAALMKREQNNAKYKQALDDMAAMTGGTSEPRLDLTAVLLSVPPAVLSRLVL